ncbi:hypothetical protein H0H87_002387, partial [Tephrocybe sp. NHM501043]
PQQPSTLTTTIAAPPEPTVDAGYYGTQSRLVLLFLSIRTSAFDVENAPEPFNHLPQNSPKPAPEAHWASFFSSCSLIIKSIAALLPPSTMVHNR